MQKLHCSKKWKSMTTHQSSHLTPAPLPSAWASPPTKTGGFALFGHTLGVRRDLSPLCESFLLCVLSTPHACTGRKHFPLQHFALVLGAQTRCYVSAGLCAAKRGNSQKWMEFHRADHLCACVEQQRKCSLPLLIFRVFVRLQEWNPFAFHIYLHFQGTTISVATLISLFALQRVLLWFILYHFFTVLPAAAAYGLSPGTCAFNSQFFKL